MEEKNIHVGPSDHVPWLEDRKWAYIRLEGTSFGDVPLNAELKIEVWDSPNSAGVVIDAVRLAKLALNKGVAGTLERPSSYLMKSPPVQYADDEARERTEEFIRKHAREATAKEAVEGRRPRPGLRAGLDSGPMGLRVCLVTPFAWSRPHDVNEHVAGIAAELRALGHSVTVLAPSTRAADLIAGRRALLDGGRDEVIALGPAVPVSRRSRIGVPVGARANLSLALAGGGYDVVHGFEPGLPSLSYLALRDSRALAVATFLSPERLGYPPGRAQRERLLGRIDALVATSEATAEAASRAPARRLPRRLAAASTPSSSGPAAKRRLVVLEWRPGERPLAPRGRRGRCGSCPTGSSSCCGRSRSRAGRRSRARCADARACARCATAPRGPRS